MESEDELSVLECVRRVAKGVAPPSSRDHGALAMLLFERLLLFDGSRADACESVQLGACVLQLTARRFDRCIATLLDRHASLKESSSDGEVIFTFLYQLSGLATNRNRKDEPSCADYNNIVCDDEGFDESLLLPSGFPTPRQTVCNLGTRQLNVREVPLSKLHPQVAQLLMGLSTDLFVFNPADKSFNLCEDVSCNEIGCAALRSLLQTCCQFATEYVDASGRLKQLHRSNSGVVRRFAVDALRAVDRQASHAVQFISADFTLAKVAHIGRESLELIRLVKHLLPAAKSAADFLSKLYQLCQMAAASEKLEFFCRLFESSFNYFLSVADGTPDYIASAEDSFIIVRMNVDAGLEFSSSTIWRNSYVVREERLPSFLTTDAAAEMALGVKSAALSRQLRHARTRDCRFGQEERAGDGDATPPPQWIVSEQSVALWVDRVVRQRCNLARARSQTAVDALLADCGLRDQLRLLRLVFLGDGGGVFLQTLAARLLPLVFAADESPATVLLPFVLRPIVERALTDVGCGARNVDLALRDGAAPAAPAAFDLCDVDALKPVQLRFTADYPCDLVLTDKCLRWYGAVFDAALQLRFVEWALDDVAEHLSLVGGARDDAPLVHRLSLSRYGMAHFVRGVRVHFAWQTVGLCSAELDKAAVASVDELSRLHKRLLSRLVVRCWLNAKSAPLRQLLEAALGHALRFRAAVLRDAEFTDASHHAQCFRGAVGQLLLDIRRLVNGGHAEISDMRLQDLIVQLDMNEFYC